MTVIDALAATIMSAGALFFIAGTIGVLRFPDLHARLHAVAKADNVGLGLIVLGLAIHAESAAVGAKLLIVWALALFSSAAVSYQIARAAVTRRDELPETPR